MLGILGLNSHQMWICYFAFRKIQSNCVAWLVKMTALYEKTMAHKPLLPKVAWVFFVAVAEVKKLEQLMFLLPLPFPQWNHTLVPLISFDNWKGEGFKITNGPSTSLVARLGRLNETSAGRPYQQSILLLKNGKRAWEGMNALSYWSFLLPGKDQNYQPKLFNCLLFCLSACSSMEKVKKNYYTLGRV